VEDDLRDARRADHRTHKLINNLRGWLRGQGLRIAKGKAETFAERMARFQPLPEYVSWQVEALAGLNEKIRGSEKRIQALAQDESSARG